MSASLSRAAGSHPSCKTTGQICRPVAVGDSAERLRRARFLAGAHVRDAKVQIGIFAALEAAFGDAFSKLVSDLRAVTEPARQNPGHHARIAELRRAASPNPQPQP
ncbi:MAG TPA: hypothetical protein VFR30_00765, partial [Lysobacter sp.]|nr:hypothetical protein [Lysobacter sp.]